LAKSKTALSGAVFFAGSFHRPLARDRVFRKPHPVEIPPSRLRAPSHSLQFGDRGPGQNRGFFGMKIIYPLVGCVTLAITAGASAGPLTDDFWLLGDFTQNVPCKGDGSDPAELKVKISTDQINSKVGICKFLDAKPDGKRVNTHVECQFPAGPLMGDITFTQKPNNTIDFVDRDKTYTATLYRCPK